MGHGEHKTYGPSYYLKGALAGGICCSLTHGAMCPVDVVKTRMQLQPAKYNQGMIAGFRQVIAEEGTGALATGLGPTAVGYFVQGWFKFGGVEFFKINMAHAFGEQRAWELRTFIYLLAAACAEFIADIFLCPLEATRIRLVSDPKFANGLLTAVPKIIAQDGVLKGFYSGFGPILFKQIPYTMAKFAVQGKAAEVIVSGTRTDMKTASDSWKMAISLASGTIAGVAAAIISHPADTLLSMINKSPTAGGTGSIVSRLVNLAQQTGLQKLCLTGLGARCVMIGTLTAGQFAVFDVVMKLTGAEKFHFHEPAKHGEEQKKH
jgi:solute carrier family 25 phosphate transporter 3